MSFAYKTATLPAGCTDSFSSSTHTVTCTGTGPFNFGSLSIGGGLTVIVNNSSSGATYNFSGTISSGSSNGMTFNGGSNATYNMAAGVSGSGSAPMSFPTGTFNIGTTTCSGNSGYSICVAGSARITFAGPSIFALAGGIYQNASGMPSTPALSLGYAPHQQLQHRQGQRRKFSERSQRRDPLRRCHRERHCSRWPAI